MGGMKHISRQNQQVARSLGEVLQGIEYVVLQKPDRAPDEPTISMVYHDSREVSENSIFVAVAGTVVDGHNYIGDAVRNGCAAVIVERGANYQRPGNWKGWLIEVEDSRKAYGAAAENYFGNPAAEMILVGITGTNGKTTITYLLEDILEQQGYRVGVIGTVTYRYNGVNGRVVMPSPFTTPEAVQLQKLLYEMAAEGVGYVIMEVSSHALSQSRIGTICFDVAAFTNLSRDHLDYHRTMEEYFQAKSILFVNHLKKKAQAVISTPLRQGDDEDWSGRIAEFCKTIGVNTITCGKGEGCDFRVLDYSSVLTATEISLMAAGRPISMKSPLVGHFNVDNCLTSLGIVSALGIDLDKAVTTLENAVGAPGRLQRVLVDDGSEQDMPVVFVDYAHTPDALKQVLATLEALPHRELYCVFGCGGDRDRGKRPVMGSFAGCFADVAIITDDNPRTEDPDEIRRQIVPGVIKAGLEQQEQLWLKTRTGGIRGFVEIGNRKEAIHSAICSAGSGDIVLIAGKGHETYQLTMQGKQFFDDCLEAEDALCSWNCHSLAKATGGDLVQKEGCEGKCLGSVSIDSRNIHPRDVFVALRGENFDGHSFLESVVEKKSGCLVVEKGSDKTIPSSISRIEVADTLRALGDLAGYRRRLLAADRNLAVAAITGSCGKTTVKEMTGAILQRRWPAGPDYPPESVLLTKGNLNNLIGLPLSLLPISRRHKAVVLEMGMNIPGEIRRMTEIADPDICCITNIHGVHLEGLGSIDGVGDAKEELFAQASKKSIFIVNIDDEQICRRAEKYSQRKILFSATPEHVHQKPDLFASDVNGSEPGVLTFTLHKGEEQEEIHLFTAGIHNVANAVAAAAIATAGGASLKEIAAGLADFRPADRRMVIEKGKNGLTVINDTYNANPVSMAAAIDALVELSPGKRGAVLSDMLELGESSADLHYQLGRKVGISGLDFLGVVGNFRDDVVRGAVDAGMNPQKVAACPDKEDILRVLNTLIDKGELGENDWLLVKGSRGGKMETIVEKMIESR
ncbi:UDP-N-acetylmuramoyl-L-alanyl-D-glutamate--2,6-diaminopimelate ligase [Desulfopila sp. IMCC35008]|uniref:UDP-N-acetylmuramoyl-L-alanyl-D-glutamate--2, 6-diaminopimelate ligase n=1 Tax=Desulfopila sp. IMCC35008 TaxID=2653858 RepID=UPI0013D55302|nr:UDP-N-acetylmuramoyl-L-alanyl-D-glutamate--2,6-diaminopimelate ligase [Desulfopila sp. IMCC35008]